MHVFNRKKSWFFVVKKLCLVCRVLRLVLPFILLSILFWDLLLYSSLALCNAYALLRLYVKSLIILCYRPPHCRSLNIFFVLLEVTLPYDPVCPSVGQSVISTGEVSIPCSYRSTCFIISYVMDGCDYNYMKRNGKNRINSRPLRLEPN